jgi:hypothetical protein
MIERLRAPGLIAAGAMLAACSGADDADAPGLSFADGSPHPVTEWGDPDLQGMWPIMHLLSTQLQRNPALGERRELTEEEYQASVTGRGSQAARDAAYHQMMATNSLGMGGWAESTLRSQQTRLTSLISYPSNGRFPALTARGEELRPEFGSSWSTERSGSGFDSPQDDFDTASRAACRTRCCRSTTTTASASSSRRATSSSISR